jgi:putative nucleotidyltransferase with HDIG domain
MPLSRDKALGLLRERLQTDFLVKHCLASEAVMRSLARRLGQDEELWGITALLHDLDFDQTRETPEKHGLVSAEYLATLGFPQEGLEAIKAHNAEHLGFSRDSAFGHALAAAETVTGLITACALVQPDKKVASVKVKSLLKRMKEKAFARNVDRDVIVECEKVGVPVEEFLQLGLEAMQGVSEDLGL